MAPTNIPLLLLGSLLLAGAISSSAMPELALEDVVAGPLMHLVNGAEDGAHALLTWLVGGEGESEYAHVLHKFIVPPQHAEAFIEAWREQHSCTKEEEGVVVHDLKKTTTDNIMFRQYGIWESKSAFMEHLKSKHVAKFAEQVKSMDIVMMVKPMKPLYAPKEGKMGTQQDGIKHQKHAYIVGDWIVPPRKAEGFLEAFAKAANATIKEEHNRIFALDKTMTDNVHFSSYGTWDTYSDWVKHLETDYMFELLNYVQEHGIVYYTAPLVKIGDQPEM